MGTAARTVIGVVGMVAVWLALATTLFSGTGPARNAPEPPACVATTAPPDPAGTASAAACTAPTPSP